MATIVKTPTGKWKALVRRSGWPTITKTFRIKRDAEDWARTTEDEVVRGLYIKRSSAEKHTVKYALKRYLKEVTPTKKPTTQSGEIKKSVPLFDALGGYSLSAVTPEVVGKYRDKRLAEGKANNTVRLELALLGHMFTVAIREWRFGLMYNPVSNVRKPSPGAGRNRRLTKTEEKKLLKAVAEHSNPMLSWIVRIALYTGMRKGEVVSLRRKQVDLRRRIVKLTETKNGSARTVPLTKQAAAVFEEALSSEVVVLGTALLFPGLPGKDKKENHTNFLGYGIKHW